MLVAEHTAGKSARAIASAYGYNRATVRAYVSGRRVPGGQAPRRADDLEPYLSYCGQRLADDPHLRTAALLAELNRIGFAGTKTKFYERLGRHGIQAHPCPACRIPRLSRYDLAQPARQPWPAWQPWPAPLPVPATPVAGETLASFLGRLAAANFITTGDLLDVLPPWFRIRARSWHDDRWQHNRLVPMADAAAAWLATISRSVPAAIKHALPAFGMNAGQPVRAVTACRLCAAARGIHNPVPVHLPAWQQVCLRHCIWLPAPGIPQFSVSSCPDILRAERRTRRLANRFTAEQLIYAKVRASAEQDETAQARERQATLARASPSLDAEPSSTELFRAAAYPDVIAAATALRSGSV